MSLRDQGAGQARAVAGAVGTGPPDSAPCCLPASRTTGAEASVSGVRPSLGLCSQPSSPRGWAGQVPREGASGVEGTPLVLGRGQRCFRHRLFHVPGLLTVWGAVGMPSVWCLGGKVTVAIQQGRLRPWGGGGLPTAPVRGLHLCPSLGAASSVPSRQPWPRLRPSLV